MNYTHEEVWIMSEEFFFYYYYEEEVRPIRRVGKREHVTHFVESDDFLSCSEGVIRPRIIEEHRPGESIYYVELVGVSDKANIKVELEGDKLRIRAIPDKTLVYPLLTGKTVCREYRAELQLPYTPEPGDVKVRFDKERGVLIIRLRKGKEPIEIEISD